MSSLPPVGVQLIVFGSKYNVNTDTDVILDSIAKAGYAAVEGGGKDAELFRKKLDERGLAFAATHVTPSNLLDLKPMVTYLNTLGGHDVCNSGLFTWNDRSLEEYKKAIKTLNEAGRSLRNEGIHLHYHNHDFEFEKVDADKNGMDILLDGLDFDVVDLCVDVAWVMRGGDNPAEYLRKHQDRIGYLHFKDFDGTDWAELGQGKVNFAEIMQVLPEMTGVRWVMAEQDSTKIDPVDSVAISRRYLRETFNY
ncbi:MAG: sugar phosphate isomerase/epimerase family protein [Armatimonadota bacterium]